MCGIVGVAGDLRTPDLNAFHNLLWIDAIRGSDNTGVVAVQRADPESWRVAKTEGDTSRLFDMNSYSKTVKDNALCIIGHNRSKTVGDTSHKNAHPFSFENIVGVHNGTLTYDSRRKFEDAGFKAQTDSEAMYAHINAHGIEKSIALMMGAWSLCWYDKRNQTINFLRNAERPMFYCFTDDLNVLFWASEVAMLYLALNRHGVKFGGTKDSKPLQLTENTLLSFPIPRAINTEFGKPTRQKMEGPKSFPPTVVYPIHSTTMSGSRAGQRMWDANHVFANKPLLNPVVTPANIINELKLERLNISTIQWDKEREPFYFGSSKTIKYSQQEFEKQMSDGGCSNCSAVPTWGEPVKFLRDGTFVCSPCLLENKDDIIQTTAML